MFGLTTKKKLENAQMAIGLIAKELEDAYKRVAELENKVRDLTVQASVSLDNDKLKAMAKWELRDAD